MDYKTAYKIVKMDTDDILANRLVELYEIINKLTSDNSRYLATIAPQSTPKSCLNCLYERDTGGISYCQDCVYGDELTHWKKRTTSDNSNR
jgi:hypothetical protein